LAIICRDHRLLFIMAPHTGCTAIGIALRDRLGGEFIPPDDIRDRKGEVVVARKHSQLSELLRHGVVSAAERRELLVASTIRNPFDALVSHYVKVNRRFSDDPEHRPDALEASATFEGWLRYRFKPNLYRRFRGWKRDEAARWTDGSDVVMRFERLQADFDDLMRRVGVEERVEIPLYNETGRRRKRPYQEFYTPAARRIVEELFAADLAEFGYRFEPLAPGAADTGVETGPEMDDD
jgi:hypothetical protein